MKHPLREMTITISSPGRLGGEEGRRALAAFYCGLLGMRIVGEGLLKIARTRETALQFALDGDGWSDERPPRWPDPEYPQQLHLDLEVPEMEATGEVAVRLGATLLQDQGSYRTYADPAGHPFCLYPGARRDDGEAVVRRLVFDCFSPRSLAAFYEGLLGVDERVEDEAERVVISLGDQRFPDFAFQHAEFVAARWPDPSYPAQLHVDVRFSDGTEAAQERAEQLGAIRLPKLADTEIYADPAAHPFCL